MSLREPNDITYEFTKLIILLKKFSVKKGTLPLRWVSSPGLFDCRSNALSSELQRFPTTFLTESVRRIDF